jgi:hypothetical protein
MTNEALAQVERLERLIADSEAVSNSMNICVLPLGCGVLKSAYWVWGAQIGVFPNINSTETAGKFQRPSSSAA